jgi:predicted metalloprotease with PDZ domain
MMHYQISRKSYCSQFIEISLSINCKANEQIHLQLASWRPGRYELANFAQKIRGFQIIKEGKSISWSKLTKDLWTFTAIEPGQYLLEYQFYCNQMDAGGCWSDDTQLYLNFSNFIFDIKEKSGQRISVEIHVPNDYEIATALPLIGVNCWEAESYQHLMDSPFLASNQLSHFSYQVFQSNFHLWFNGPIHFDMDQLIMGFKNFTAKQIEAFGEFPAKDYHFIFQLLPYKHYHGVEHAFSTVITYGPAEKLSEKKELDELFGVSSHELYHFWNVCRIRPKELLEYDLSKESYLDTGLVLEGVTSYMGDLFLVKSRYFSLEEYLVILEKQIQKEHDNFGWKNQSIVESSFDLWLDGYKPGIPEKKVSIYNRGALLALCLDLILLDDGSSLSQVMQHMWKKFGISRMAYSLEDFKEIISSKIKKHRELEEFFSQYVFGHEDIFPLFKSLLDSIGIRVEETYTSDNLLHNHGIRTNDKGKIIQIHPESFSYHHLMLEDYILNIEKITNSDISGQLELEISRWGRNLSVSVPTEKRKFFPHVKLNVVDENQKLKLWME